MLIFDKKIALDKPVFKLTDLTADKILYFDIETTGLSPVTCGIYLIGCVYYDGEEFHIKQWFDESGTSEKELLHSFMEFLKDYSALIHYNGTGFDIPFIIKKCQLYHIECDLSNIESFDIYKKISPFRKLFSIDNLKQKTIESFLSVNRTDKYSGGELINMYIEYIKTKDDSLKDILLLHNHDDILGMMQILPIVNYSCITGKGYDVIETEYLKDKQEVSFKLALFSFLPKRVSAGNSIIYFTACGDSGLLSIKTHNDELKYFYPNYKDYYYLPHEDRSIHKSVAFFVDKDFRTKAKAANCYSKKTGIFLPQYEEIINPYFKIDYYDKMTYFEYSDELLNNKQLLIEYCNSLINKII